jgi:hypothetical protein
MKKAKLAIIGLMAAMLVAGPFALSLSAQAPTVSEKKDVAIFALGYYGWAIPQETLGSIDQEIQKVFVDLGRFNIIGVTQRLSSGGVQAFIDTLKKAKEANFVVPEKYQFGEATLTEAEFNKLLGAFIVATPVVSEFNSFYNDKKGQWETDIKTNVTFIDVGAGGTVIGIAEVKSSGSDKSNQNKSISSAIEGIPMQLQYEVRKVPAFQISTRVLAVSGGEIKLQLGQNMGIRKGDEYAVIVGGMVEGFKDTREAGLVAIKDVGAEVSTGQVLYSSVKLGKDAQLQEIPRIGFDVEPFFHLVNGSKIAFGGGNADSGANSIAGLRLTASRGFYGFRPFIGVETPINGIKSIATVFLFPVNVIAGAEYRAYLGRLSVTPYGAIGGSYLYVTEAISGYSRDTSGSMFPHVGGFAYLNLSYLVTRNVRIFADIGAEYWMTLADWLYSSYGGVGFGAGVSFKL